jgi:hypothetical protein
LLKDNGELPHDDALHYLLQNKKEKHCEIYACKKKQLIRIEIASPK